MGRMSFAPSDHFCVLLLILSLPFALGSSNSSELVLGTGDRGLVNGVLRTARHGTKYSTENNIRVGVYQ